VFADKEAGLESREGNTVVDQPRNLAKSVTVE